MKTGIELIAEERRRQIDVEGWTPEHDDEHNRGEMARAAACYAMSAAGDSPEWGPAWPWDWSWWKPKDPISDLKRAGALIAAELDRRLRSDRGTQEGERE